MPTNGASSPLRRLLGTIQRFLRVEAADRAKLGILGGSLLSGAFGWALLSRPR